ncbi:hypothetical protein VTK73DRAFT_1011 [Phialemonium thermophilum]|uniref:C2H2-type domain-containing protein n=1 Tax=Phialemonium thermophilum TaxID=223376 RepID=A0ABR3XCL9_9PEZI
MALFQGLTAGGIAAAFRHFKDSGVPREALEQALSEVYQEQGEPQISEQKGQDQAPISSEAPKPLFESETPCLPLSLPPERKRSSATRLSVSTTSSKSSGRSRSRSSVLSTATSISSVSSLPAHERHLSQSTSQSSAVSVPIGKPATAPRYWCTSCETTFARKYDWKRHEEEFHERYRRYPCPGCNRVFWGANTFNQHHKTAHNCTTCPHAYDVVIYTKRKCAWGCGICAAFLPSRDRFFDHVSKHFESGMTKPEHWTHSRVIYGLLHQPHVYQAWKELVSLLWGENQPSFSWNPETTGRAPGFLENGSPGKLQDFLEFFNEKTFDVRQLVQLAHDQADIVPRFPPAAALHYSHPTSSALSLPDGLPLMSQSSGTDPRASSSPGEGLSSGSQPDVPMTGVAIPEHQIPTHSQRRALEYPVGNVPRLEVSNHQYITAPMRFPETIVELPEVGFYNLAPQNQLPVQQSPSEDWNSIANTVVEGQMWAADDRRFSQQVQHPTPN